MSLIAIFPPGSLDFLYAVSQIGLSLYMFVIGLSLNTASLWLEKKITSVISVSSVLCSFLLGFSLAIYLYPTIFDGSVPRITFAIFIGVAMSVTAFPVLARILTERDLLSTRVGTVAIAAAAFDDISAWLMLTAIVVYAQAFKHQAQLWLTLLGLGVFVFLQLFGVRPALLRLYDRHWDQRQLLTHSMLGIIFLLLFASAWATESLSIHALFGAFFAGFVMPKKTWLTQDLTARIEPLVTVLLLPLFFTLTGMRTNIWAVSGTEMWMAGMLIIAVAIAGKLGGTAISARLGGMPWRESLAIGVLMNTRGLMEMVILNVGFELGIIPASLFSMMVLMALVTTFMTSPLLSLIYPTSHTIRISIIDNSLGRIKGNSPLT